MILTPLQILEKKDIQLPCYVFYDGEWVRATAIHESDDSIFIFYRPENSASDSSFVIDPEEKIFICISPEINPEEEERCKEMHLELLQDIKNRIDDLYNLARELPVADIKEIRNYSKHAGLDYLTTGLPLFARSDYATVSKIIRCLKYGYLTLELCNKEYVSININHITKITKGKKFSIIVTLANGEEITVPQCDYNKTEINILICLFTR